MYNFEINPDKPVTIAAIAQCGASWKTIDGLRAFFPEKQGDSLFTIAQIADYLNQAPVCHKTKLIEWGFIRPVREKIVVGSLWKNSNGREFLLSFCGPGKIALVPIAAPSGFLCFLEHVKDVNNISDAEWYDLTHGRSFTRIHGHLEVITD